MQDVFEIFDQNYMPAPAEISLFDKTEVYICSIKRNYLTDQGEVLSRVYAAKYKA